MFVVSRSCFSSKGKSSCSKIFNSYCEKVVFDRVTFTAFKNGKVEIHS